MQKISLSIHRSNIIKGLAIIAVVLLHIFSQFHGIYNSNKQIIFIFFDQLSRFCVPAFIMLSGYGLAFKYEDQDINYFEFLKKRVLKLLPLYLLWSVMSIVILDSVPAWSSGWPPKIYLSQLLLGQADYQLYFLPVIFQLYAIFPLLWLFRKKPNWLLATAVTAQTALYIYYMINFSGTDRFEYIVFLSWIAYFIFGIYLKLKGIPDIIAKLALPFGLGFLGMMVLSSLTQINSGIDPLPALKFTRLIVIPFGLMINLGLIVLKFDSQNRAKKTLSNCLAWLGQNSYIIFLSHTISLRIISVIVNNQITPFILLRTMLMWIATIYVSQKFLSGKKRKPVINS